MRLKTISKNFKKSIDKQKKKCYNEYIIKKGQGNLQGYKIMRTPKGQGTYYFADGTIAWFYGLSATEKKNEIRKHGAIIKFIPN